MTALNMAKHRNNPNFAFWKMIKEGYDHFEATHQEPKVAVCEKRYVFDPAQPENATRPLKFDARGQCPVFRLDPTIADAVLDHRRQEQVQMANYIARDVATVPFRVGDGGTNSVFAAKLTSPNIFDNNGRIYQVAGNSQIASGAQVPGALPRTPNPPAVTAEPARTSQPVVMASVPMPQPAPQAKEGEAPPEKPKSIAGLLGNLFSGAQARPTEPAREPDSRLARQQYRNGGETETRHPGAHCLGAGRAACQAAGRRVRRADGGGEKCTGSGAGRAASPQGRQVARAGNAHRLFVAAAREQQRYVAGRAAGGSGRFVREPLDRATLTRAI